MRKQDEVREKIVNHAMLLFNTKGIARTSIQDIMQAAELPKGAIYRRFETKELIVLAAFERAGQILLDCITQAVQKGRNTIDKLMAIMAIYQDAVDNPPVPGGCPLLNTAIESDGTFPELQQRAAQAYISMVRFAQSIIEDGIQNKELRPDVDSASLASHIISSGEGAIMASRLTGSNEPVEHNLKYTEILLRSYLMTPTHTPAP